MSDAPNDSETSQDSPHHAPQPPPFNPMPAHASQPPTLGNSVVPTLMNVYESMTQSSTPQDPNNPVTSLDSAYNPTHHMAQQQQGTYDPYYHGSAVPPGSQPPQHVAYYPHTNQQQQTRQQSQQQQQPTHYYASPSVPPESYQGPAPPVIPPVPDYPTTTAVTQTPLQQSIAPAAHPTFPIRNPARSAPDAAPSSAATGNGRSLRKRSLEKDTTNEKPTSKTRKKGSNTDGRWSKRFTWPDDLHRDFVSAIFDVGLKHSSPSAILEHMPKHEQITSERIKSHLQKYRLHRTKSKKEFMSSYDASISKLKEGGVMDGKNSTAQGKMAAHLTYSTTTDNNMSNSSGTTNQGGKQDSAPRPKPPPTAPKDNSSKLVLPQLSEAEKKSPIGTSLGYLMGLFFSLRQQLMAQRAAQTAAAGSRLSEGVSSVPGANSQVGAVYSHFATGAPENYPQEMVPAWSAPVAHDVTVPPVSQVFHQDAISEQKHDAKAPPSTRTNFEQNKLMKLEMQNQMAFQNKMRDLKQRELNKYKPVPEQSIGHGKAAADDLTPNPVSVKKHMDEAKVMLIDSSMNRSQGAGETAEAGDSTVKGRPQDHSVSDDFWNTDVVDEQLFEFLMNP